MGVLAYHYEGCLWQSQIGPGEDRELTGLVWAHG